LFVSVALSVSSGHLYNLGVYRFVVSLGQGGWVRQRRCGLAIATNAPRDAGENLLKRLHTNFHLHGLLCADGVPVKDAVGCRQADIRRYFVVKREVPQPTRCRKRHRLKSSLGCGDHLWG
jgi:hypothetical protein